MNELTKIEPEKREVAIATTDAQSSILAVIARAAADPTIDVDKMERLLALQERVMAKEAEAAFNAAMSAAQAEIPAVRRDAKNPSTNSLYTRLETLHAVIVPVYTQHGFALSYGTADCPMPEYFRTTCVVTHRAGHSRNYQIDLPRDDMGAKGLPNKTKMHGMGSTFSYARRYLSLMIFNVSLTNEDDDGNGGRRQAPPGPSKAQRPAPTPEQHAGPTQPTPEARPPMATPKTRSWMLQELADIGDAAMAYGIDKGYFMPNEPVTNWDLAFVPTTKEGLAELRRKIEAHK